VFVVGEPRDKAGASLNLSLFHSARHSTSNGGNKPTVFTPSFWVIIFNGKLIRG